MRKANCEQSAKRSVDTFNASNQAELRKQIELRNGFKSGSMLSRIKPDFHTPNTRATKNHKNLSIFGILSVLEQKMSKSPNNMKDGGSHFLYRRERMIRFKMLQKNMPQKMLAKRLKLTESYISKLITGERYNKDFERYIIHILDMNYICI